VSEPAEKASSIYVSVGHAHHQSWADLLSHSEIEQPNLTADCRASLGEAVGQADG